MLEKGLVVLDCEEKKYLVPTQTVLRLTQPMQETSRNVITGFCQ